MQLHVERWGAEDSAHTAVLVHGITSNASGWQRVARRLVERGYQVSAVDLRGHGSSPRTPGNYPLAGLVQDLGDSLPTAPDLLVGHSLGGFLCVLAVERGLVRPRRLVLEDPALILPGRDHAARFVDNSEAAPRGADRILAANPRWGREDAEAKAAAVAALDWAQVRELFVDNAPWNGLPELRSIAGRLPVGVILADPSELVPPELARELESLLGQGSVVTVPAAGHSIHRDDLEGFLAALFGWLETQDRLESTERTHAAGS